MPVVDGRSPVMTEVREGLHSGDWQWALVNSVPRAASRSRFGVFTIGWPAQPMASLRCSSEMMMRRLCAMAPDLARLDDHVQAVEQLTPAVALGEPLAPQQLRHEAGLARSAREGRQGHDREADRRLVAAVVIGRLEVPEMREAQVVQRREAIRSRML